MSALDVIQHFAGERGDIPAGLKFRFLPANSASGNRYDEDYRWTHRIHATLPDQEGHVGELRWAPRAANRDDDGYGPGEISWVGVHPDHQRKGIASAMMEHARTLHRAGQVDSLPIHSTTKTPDGKGWAEGRSRSEGDYARSVRGFDDAVHDDYSSRSPALTKGDFVKTTSIHQERLDRAWGSNDIDSLLPDGKPMTIAPWPAAGRRKDRKDYDHDAVKEMLRKPPELTPVDPRTLHSTQPNITRQALEHYMGGKGGDSTFGDHGNPGNRHPVVYHREDGTSMILSGHHRAAAALLRGEPLMARQIHGPWPAR